MRLTKTLHILAIMLLAAAPLLAKEYSDSAVYQGLNLKLDVGNSIYHLISKKGAVQQYEMALNVNLKKIFYPTIEGGYGWGRDGADGGNFYGHGGFAKVGLDLNPIKKNRNNDYVLLVGIRVGMSMMDYELTNVTQTDAYWGNTSRDYPMQFRADAWGEVVAGCQIKVAGPFTMGWFARAHFLFTEKTGDHQPFWIPGYGYKDGGRFTFNYYLGWRF